MTFNNKVTDKKNSPYSGYDHVRLTVSNSKQAASYYCTRLGFKYHAYRELETGSRETATYAVRNGDVIFVLECSVVPDTDTEIARDVAHRGNAVKDMVFTVNDCRAVYEKAISRGGKPIKEPEEITDENGTVVIATLATYGDTQHSLIERHDYKGLFLPGFKGIYEALSYKDPLQDLLPDIPYRHIDHIVGAQKEDEMEPILMADPSETIKTPINEPVEGLKKSQIQEFVDYHANAGVQHIAINTDDIITCVTNLRKRGVEFLHIPIEDLDVLERLKILVDYDENGYLLQIFTKPVEDRPKLFIEIIQHKNHDGFGAGNVKCLFESFEEEQKLRDNLTDYEKKSSN